MKEIEDMTKEELKIEKGELEGILFLTKETCTYDNFNHNGMDFWDADRRFHKISQELMIRSVLENPGKTELKEIKYKFVVDLTRFFVGKYNDGEIKDLKLIINNVKALSNFVKDMAFVYDETIWPPDKPDWYKNMIEFKVQMINDINYLPFRLFINKGQNQEPVFLNSSMMWEY